MQLVDVLDLPNGLGGVVAELVELGTQHVQERQLVKAGFEGHSESKYMRKIYDHYEVCFATNGEGTFDYFAMISRR